MPTNPMNNSYTTQTNIRFGTADMKNLFFNAQTMNLPSIMCEPPQQNTRAGGVQLFASDTVHYDDLNITAILDKNWKVYDDLYEYFLEGLNVETGKFSHFKEFDLWADFYDGKGKVTKRFWFYGCRLTSFGGVELNTTDMETNNIINLTFKFLYMDYDNNFSKK